MLQICENLNDSPNDSMFNSEEDELGSDLNAAFTEGTSYRYINRSNSDNK